MKKKTPSIPTGFSFLSSFRSSQVQITHTIASEQACRYLASSNQRCSVYFDIHCVTLAYFKSFTVATNGVGSWDGTQNFRLGLQVSAHPARSILARLDKERLALRVCLPQLYGSLIIVTPRV